jgi:hypothetical protein
VVPNLDTRILEIIETGPGVLDMKGWHGRNGDACGTTHCRAGWAVNLAGQKGLELEHKVGSEMAGRAIYLASTGRCPYFFASNEDALADIKRCASEEKEASNA